MQSIVRKVLSETDSSFPYAAYDLVIQDFGGQFRPRMAVTRTDSTRATSSWGQLHDYGEWIHLAGVYDGARVRIYVNGSEEASTAFTGNIMQVSQPLLIGRYGSAGEAVKGQLDDACLRPRPCRRVKFRLFRIAAINRVRPPA
jgi:hypothetical protein